MMTTNQQGSLDASTGKTNYIAWLENRGTPLFRIGDQYWQRYKEALVPATTAPCFVSLNEAEARTLLRESAAWFLRYCSDPTKDVTDWWYVVCDHHDPSAISAKIRQNINRGNRNCTVRPISPEWLAREGYQCYSAAFRRYANASPAPSEEFSRVIRATGEGPFEYWGVFAGESLAGYCKCIIEGGYVNTAITKYDPEFLKLRSSYALVARLIEHYVQDRKMKLSNGNRAVLHDTNYQEFLLKLGFRKQFCRLNITYRPSLAYLVHFASAFFGTLKGFPDHGFLHKAKGLLIQEELRRLCLDTSPHDSSSRKAVSEC